MLGELLSSSYYMSYQPDRDRRDLPAGMEIFFISVVGVVTELKDVM